MTLKDIYIPIQQSLNQVDEELKRRTNHTIDVLAGGKRLRPALLLFSTHAFDDTQCKDVILTASALEMIHSASLIHDDIIDGSAQRRSRPSFYSSLGVKPAVIFGDFLFVQGLTKLETVKPTRVLSMVVRAVKAMCEGQWLELEIPARNDFTQQDYLKIIDKKTASLFACGCEIGGLFRHASKEELTYLRDFGRNFGFAYQLLDDAADFSESHSDRSERKLREWGGQDYCKQTALEFSEQARLQIAHLTNDVERKGFEQILLHIWR